MLNGWAALAEESSWATLSFRSDEHQAAKVHADLVMLALDAVYSDYERRVDLNSWRAVLEIEAATFPLVREELAVCVFNWAGTHRFLPESVWSYLDHFFDWNHPVVLQRIAETTSPERINSLQTWIKEQVFAPSVEGVIFPDSTDCRHVEDFFELRDGLYRGEIPGGVSSTNLLRVPGQYPAHGVRDYHFSRLLVWLARSLLPVAQRVVWCQRFCQAWPQDVVACLELALALEQHGQIEEAKQSYVQVLNVDGNCLDALKGVARCALVALCLDEAWRCVVLGLKQQPHDLECLQLQNRIVRQKIDGLLVGLSDLSGKAWWARVQQIVDLYLECQAFEPCGQFALCMLRMAPPEYIPHLHVVYVKSLLSLKRRADVTAYILPHLKAQDGSFFKHNGLVELYAHHLVGQGLYVLACQWLNASIEAGCKTIAVYRLLGEAWRMRGNYRKALKALNQCLLIQRDAEALWIRSAIYLDLSRYRECQLDCESFLLICQTDAKIYHRLGLCLEVARQWTAAQEAMKKACDLNPSWPAPWLALLHLALRQRHFELAHRTLEHIKTLEHAMPDVIGYWERVLFLCRKDQKHV